MLADPVSGEVPLSGSRWLSSHCALMWKKGGGGSLGPFLRALILFIRALIPHDLITSQSAHLLTP